MGEKTGSVDYQEALSIKVGNWLIQKGFGLAENTGFGLSELVESSSLGITWQDPNAKPIKLNIFFAKARIYPTFLGVVWFEGKVRNADEQNWVLEAHGRDQVDRITKLANELAADFKVRITIRLISEESKLVNYSFANAGAC